MATNSLYRSCTESGKCHSSKLLCRAIDRQERRKVKLWIKKLKNEDVKEDAPPVPSKHCLDQGDRSHRHRTLYRFLDSHVGEPWEQVYHMLCQRLTFYQRHREMLNIHRVVSTQGSSSSYGHYPPLKMKCYPELSMVKICAWTKDRLVFLNHSKYYWAIPAVNKMLVTTYHQDQLLSEEDLAFYKSLPLWQQTQITHKP